MLAADAGTVGWRADRMPIAAGQAGKVLRSNGVTAIWADDGLAVAAAIYCPSVARVAGASRHCFRSGADSQIFIRWCAMG